MTAGADGIARIPLDLPDFAGELRLMAVAWDGTRIGAASRALTVRDPLVAEALLPRYLAPGDEARLSVLLHNVELPAGEVSATLEAEGAITLGGAARLTATLATGARAVPFTTLRATGQGEGVLRLAVTFTEHSGDTSILAWDVGHAPLLSSWRLHKDDGDDSKATITTPPHHHYCESSCWWGSSYPNYGCGS